MHNQPGPQPKEGEKGDLPGAGGVTGARNILRPQDEQQHTQFGPLLQAIQRPQSKTWQPSFCACATLSQRLTGKGILGNVVLAYRNSFYIKPPCPAKEGSGTIMIQL